MSAIFIFQDVPQKIKLPTTNFDDLTKGIESVFKLSSVQIFEKDELIVSLDGLKPDGKYLVKGEKAPPSTASDQKGNEMDKLRITYAKELTPFRFLGLFGSHEKIKTN